MDLDDFEQLQSEDQATRAPPNFENSLPSLLRYFDELWYSAANRRGFVMDLMGDYGGSELFIIHGPYKQKNLYLLLSPLSSSIGDSLLQNILDDPLLAIANDTGTILASLHFTELTSFRSKLSDNACYLRYRTYNIRIKKEISKFTYCFLGRYESQ